MKYIQQIDNARSDPQALEALYQSAVQENTATEFSGDLIYCYKENRDDILLAAWYFRLQSAAAARETVRKPVNWGLAIPLAVITAIVFWVLSDQRFTFSRNGLPHLLLLWTPLSTLGVLAYLALTSRKNQRRALYVGAGLSALTVLTFFMVAFIGDRYREHFQVLGSLHLALLSWIAVGIYVLGFTSPPNQRFAFLIRSLEVFITGGVYTVVGMMFAMITMQLFEALSINLDEIYIRLIFAGGSGLIPILAVVSIYDPNHLPLDQDFKQGLSRFTATMMRILLPLTLIVLVIYILVIPFNFMEPFRNRDVLIVYNIMLFAVMGLLIGVTPVFSEEVSSKVSHWLAAGVVAVAILTVAVNLYALSAILYRTFTAELTINRLTIIGWNVINIVILIAAIVAILRGKREEWAEKIKPVFSRGAVAYMVWSLFVLIAIPLVFR
ncbi:MAG: hypothetical protein GYA34_01420 [Chloroflexi bacterium]|nr:hypothetical protein [Chloroflexota bacterium]